MNISPRMVFIDKKSLIILIKLKYSALLFRQPTSNFENKSSINNFYKILKWVPLGGTNFNDLNSLIRTNSKKRKHVGTCRIKETLTTSRSIGSRCKKGRAPSKKGCCQTIIELDYHSSIVHPLVHSQLYHMQIQISVFVLLLLHNFSQGFVFICMILSVRLSSYVFLFYFFQIFSLKDQ
jgi:hypothetical protein